MELILFITYLSTNKQTKKDAIYNLPNDTLKQIYLGQKNGRLLILNFQRISSGLFRLQVRDLVSNDDFVCQSESQMATMIPGDLVDFENAKVIPVPEIKRNAILLGPTKLIARWKEASWEHLPVVVSLPPRYFAIC